APDVGKARGQQVVREQLRQDDAAGAAVQRLAQQEVQRGREVVIDQQQDAEGGYAEDRQERPPGQAAPLGPVRRQADQEGQPQEGDDRRVHQHQPGRQDRQQRAVPQGGLAADLVERPQVEHGAGRQQGQPRNLGQQLVKRPQGGQGRQGHQQA